MFRVTKYAFAAMIVAADITVSVLPAAAQGIELRVGPGGVDVRDRDRYPDRYERRGCSPDEALDAARDEGFRRARIASANSRRIVIEGMTRRGPDRIVFANARGCPEI
ncbi:hypothetical protein [Rhizobium sp. 2MFCol3.1]|uniref:hypothetical protein n=1 Tax=Rhizobium sp. 2MFCol3.1 TaxID=1246459 RepID=UPI0009D9784C|nr:hypothetical protein [Rhizobium sp. 2MFCol3.1]